MTTTKQNIIANIKAMLKPKHLMAAYFIESDQADKWQHKGKLLTKDECRKVKASRHYFLSRASAS